MRILLVRHGESEGNVDKTVHTRMADHAIPLSEKGREEARKAGDFLARWFVADQQRIDISKTEIRDGRVFGEPYALMANVHSGKFDFRLWESPYRRTRQTADEILETLKTRAYAVPGWGRREHILLAEQRFGLFDGLEDDALQAKYPDEYEHYKKCEAFEGRFWASMPLGESRFDVATRVHQAFGTFHRDAEKGCRTLVIVAHGTTIRAFVMMWLHKPFEWFETEPNPKNCSIRYLEDTEKGKVDHGYIYPGAGA